MVDDTELERVPRGAKSLKGMRRRITFLQPPRFGNQQILFFLQKKKKKNMKDVSTIIVPISWAEALLTRYSIG